MHNIKVTLWEEILKILTVIALLLLGVTIGWSTHTSTTHSSTTCFSNSSIIPEQECWNVTEEQEKCLEYNTTYKVPDWIYEKSVCIAKAKENVTTLKCQPKPIKECVEQVCSVNSFGTAIHLDCKCSRWKYNFEVKA